MTDEEQKALRNYCAFILKEYGFQFSPTDPVVPALYVIHRELRQNNISNKAIANQISELVSSRRVVAQAPDRKHRWWKPKAILVSATVLCLLILFAVIQQDEDHLTFRRKKMETLLNRMQMDNDGYYYLDFREAAGTSVKNFTEYTKTDDKTARVYLGK